MSNLHNFDQQPIYAIGRFTSFLFLTQWVQQPRQRSCKKWKTSSENNRCDNPDNYKRGWNGQLDLCTTTLCQSTQKLSNMFLLKGSSAKKISLLQTSFYLLRDKSTEYCEACFGLVCHLWSNWLSSLCIVDFRLQLLAAAAVLWLQLISFPAA